MTTAEGCSLESAVAYMCSPVQVDPKVGDLHPVSSSVPDVYDVDLEAEGDWYLSDITPSREIDVRSSLRSTSP